MVVLSVSWHYSLEGQGDAQRPTLLSLLVPKHTKFDHLKKKYNKIGIKSKWTRLDRFVNIPARQCFGRSFFLLRLLLLLLLVFVCLFRSIFLISEMRFPPVNKSQVSLSPTRNFNNLYVTFNSNFKQRNKQAELQTKKTNKQTSMVQKHRNECQSWR